MDSPLDAVSVFPTLVQENLGGYRTGVNVVGRIAAYANSKTSPFVFLCLHVICRGGELINL